MTDTTETVTSAGATLICGVSRSTFNEWVRRGPLPEGIRRPRQLQRPRPLRGRRATGLGGAAGTGQPVVASVAPANREDPYMATEDMNTRYVRAGAGALAGQVGDVERERDLYRVIVDALREHRDLDAELLALIGEAPMSRIQEVKERQGLAWRVLLDALAVADAEFPPDATRPPTGTGGLEGKGGEGSSDVKPTPSR